MNQIIIIMIKSYIYNNIPDNIDVHLIWHHSDLHIKHTELVQAIRDGSPTESIFVYIYEGVNDTIQKICAEIHNKVLQQVSM